MIEQSKFKKLSVFGKLIFGKAAQMLVTLSTGAVAILSADELGALDVVPGTGTAGKAVVLDANGAATYPGVQNFSANKFATEAGAGITGGATTIYRSAIEKEGGMVRSTILLGIKDLQSSTTDLDIIGQGVLAAHLGQFTLARNGTWFSGTMTCLEAPLTGVTDIDLYSATEATGKFDDAIGGLTSTALVTSGGAWTIGLSKPFTASVVANKYLYLTNGAAGTVGTYTAGKFRLTMDAYQ